MPNTKSASDEIIAKIPQVTLAFWIMKICATTLGETAGDLLSMTLKVGYATSCIILLTLFGIGLIVLATLSLPLLGNKAQLAAHDQLYSRLCKKMAQYGYPKQTSEGPLAYRQRLESHLDAAQMALVHAFIDRYIQIKYGKNDSHLSVPERTKNTLRELHSLLKKIK